MSKALSRIMTVTAGAVTLSALVGYGICREARCAPPPATKSVPIRPMIVGMNLGTLNYWSSEWPFNDIIKNASEIRLIDSAGRWSGDLSPLHPDAGGHPTSVPAGTRVVVVLNLGASRAQVGTYQCHISPGWAVKSFGDAQIQGSGTSFTLKIASPTVKFGSAIILTAQTNGASLTELSCPSSNALLNPAFLEDNRPFKVLRFMDWMKTNNAPQRSWATRPTPNSLSQGAVNGASVEYMVQIANTLNADPWFNMPFHADADYYRRFATYVRDHLARDRKVYVEYSNEVWNTSFQQGKDSVRLGQARYPGVSASQASDWYYADQVRAVMAIWSDVFRGQESRLVRVLASQQVNPGRAEQALAHNDTWKSVDALSTAGYFGAAYKGTALPGQERISAIFAEGPSSVDRYIAYSKAGKAIADRYGLRYVAYEGGLALSPGSDKLLAQDNYAAQHDPRAYELYMQFLNRWRTEIGDLLILFDSVSPPGPGRAWYGHKLYTGQPLSEAQKMRAAVDAAK